ncbi:MAG: hypothetical protein II937_17655 [Bacteroidales bacterium]|nr:hypothetical protein [Bacteroidales bacterium]
MRKIFIIIVGVLMSANVFAQTAYQSKCHQIFIKYMKMFVIGSGNKWGQSEDFAFSQLGYGEGGAASGLLTTSLLAYCGKTGKSYDAITKQINAEYTAARKLMTPQEKFEMKVNEESQKPYGKVKWQSAVDLKNWMEKGEFETTEQYDSRIKEQSRQKMGEFIFNNLNKEIAEDFWKMYFGDYDADKQELNLVFVDNNNKYQITRKINVSPQNAKYLKSHCYSGDPQMYIDGAIQSFNDDGQDDNGNMKAYWDEKGNMHYDVKNDVMKMQYDIYEMCVVKNDIFVPRYFYVDSEFGEWQFDNSETESLAKFNYADWVGKPKQMEAYVFDYQEYGKPMREKAVELQKERKAEEARLAAEKAREDSIAIANYNAELEKTYNSYNQQLKDKKSNIKHYAIEKYEPMTENDLTQFNNKKHQMQHDFERYVKKIKDDYWAVKNEYFRFYDDTEEFDKYYCQGLEVLVAQSEYRDVMSQLEQNKAAIAQVNFQKEMNNNSFMNVISEQPVDYTKINEYRKKLLEWVSTLKSKTYYDDVIDFLINNNAALGREFSKSGSKFDSKSEFYDAYISGDYKNILKGKK